MESQHATLKIRIATINRGDRGHSQNKRVTWDRLCERLGTPEIDKKYTLPEYLELGTDRQNHLKDVGSFVGGWFDDGVRKFNKLTERSIVTLDIDSATAEQIEFLRSGLSKVCKYEFFGSTTRKHSRKKPRWRVVFPITRPVTVEEYGPLSRILASRVFKTLEESMDAIDDVSFRPAQIMYWPSACKDALFETIHNEGRLLNPTKVLESFGDWRDWTLLPHSESRGIKRPVSGVKAEDPREKKGIIGAFCRAYDVPTAIEMYLPDRYELGDENSTKPRYTYLLGSSSNGAIVEDDGLFMYSHHGTDPCAERLVNAFDLVRIHLFGDLDAGAPADATATELPSFAEMRKLCRDDPNLEEEFEDFGPAEVEFEDLSDESDEEPDRKKTKKASKTPDKPKKKAHRDDDYEDDEDEKPRKKTKKDDEDELPEPDLSVLAQSKHPAPSFPADVLGEFWAKKAREWAKASAGPVDYSALTLLVGAAAAIGNSRWVQAKPGWAEPPVLWCSLVGRPSSNKSPSMGQLTGILSNLESSWIPLYKEQLREHEGEKRQAAMRRKVWENQVEAMVEDDSRGIDDDEIPLMPRNCEEPQKPQRRRIVLNDVTLEKMMQTLAGNPRGLLNYRDELSGWFANLSRYSNGSDRPAWLEAYGGRPYTVDRVKFEDMPLFVRHFSVSILGGIQPERLLELLTSGEDGLQARFIYSWPESMPQKLLETEEMDSGVADAFEKLTALNMEPDEFGNADPVYVPLSRKAWARFSEWAYDHAVTDEGAAPALQSVYGKANGLVLRIALVLQFMWWASQSSFDDDHEEPGKVSVKAIEASIALRDQYIAPMQVRVFSQVGVSDAEKHAGDIARWIMNTKPKELDMRVLLRADLPGLDKAVTLSAAIERLAMKNWLIPIEKAKADHGGRPLRGYTVNPKVYA